MTMMNIMAFEFVLLGPWQIHVCKTYETELVDSEVSSARFQWVHCNCLHSNEILRLHLYGGHYTNFSVQVRAYFHISVIYCHKTPVIFFY